MANPPSTPEPEWIRARVGAEFEVKLESVPGSGAKWIHTTDKTSGSPELVAESTVPTDHPIGSPVTQVFKFRPDKPGRYVLTFHLKRMWETEPRQTTNRTVEVSA